MVCLRGHCEVFMCVAPSGGVPLWNSLRGSRRDCGITLSATVLQKAFHRDIPRSFFLCDHSA